MNNNIVFFGATKAVVSSATASQLIVEVPAGATYQNISVSNFTTGLTAYSTQPFITTFSCGNGLSSSSFALKVNYANGIIFPESVAISDLDGDGKPDLAISSDNGTGPISVLKNTSTNDSISFAAKIDNTTWSGSISVNICDFNGDSKPDLVAVNHMDDRISVLKNTSTMGSISFAHRSNYTTGNQPWDVAIGDIDGDGKPDLAIANMLGNTISVFKNTSTFDTITFAPKIDFATESTPSDVAISDINGDGKPDIVVASASPYFTILKNTSTVGAISFAPFADFGIGVTAQKLTIGDFNGDNKPDLAFLSITGNFVFIYKNTSAISNISFASRAQYSTGNNVFEIATGDLNGDGLLDLAFTNKYDTTVSVLQNTSTMDTITFATRVNYKTGLSPGCVKIGDLNGDGKPDLVVTNSNSNNISVLKNEIGISSAKPIIGQTTVCQGQNSVVYTVPVINNATSYIWSLPNGATGASTTNSITVDYGFSATSGDISVKGHNTCGDGVAFSLPINVSIQPDEAGIISGAETACQGQNSVTYSVPAITNATSYIWTLPSGATGTSTTNSITVSYGTSAVSGNITVKGTSTCGNGATSTLAVTINSLPAAAGTITGTATVCPGQSSVSYSVPTIANATSYIWSLPSGATGTSTTNSITVSYGTSAVSGNITVKGTNTCGNGATSTKAITVNSLPIAAGNIIGTATVCQGQNSVNYGVPTITNATSYIWTLPSGATGTSTTNSITVSYDISAVSGNITVKGTNACGNGLTSTKAITVNMLPTAAGIITGTATVCQGQNSVSYTVPSITNATSYIWTLPSGATGTSTTNSITVSYIPSAVSGNITVKGTNTCGNGATSTKAITVNSLPAVAGIITGTATVCQGQNSVTYSVPAITNATSYIWTLPSGATGTSTTNSITVSYGTSAVSGNITVKGNNTCGVGTSSSFPILVNTKPSTPNITLSGNNLLQSNSINGNQWYDQNGIINGATNQSYTVLANGDYYVIVTLLGCSSDASSNLNVILTGIEATENNKSIKVFPNPVSNELIIESEGNNVRLNFEILNAIGQVIFKGNLVEKTTVQTSDFTPGVYLIKLENGKTFEFKKIIKE
jgi:stress response protein SCP2